MSLCGARAFGRNTAVSLPFAGEPVSADHLPGLPPAGNPVAAEPAYITMPDTVKPLIRVPAENIPAENRPSAFIPVELPNIWRDTCGKSRRRP